jgi:Zn-dependent protease with chaperone function
VLPTNVKTDNNLFLQPFTENQQQGNLMDRIYPAGPASVPDNLTAPTAAYKQRAWIALAGLALFVALYLFLSGWFAWTAWRLISGALEGGKNVIFGWGFGLSAAFLAVFMIKALVFVKHGGKSDDTEITAAQQPELFAFIHRLADEAGAPRPHRVYLSPRVNAAVFYDLSILNLLFPSKKNLEIGLGLVNVLTLGEFKAVIAHEFGHFAQRTMAVGRWVYIGQQIAAHIVAKRDALDRFLQGLSGFDFRIAWIGWILRLIVWSIRSLVETVFNGVLMAQRALSRQMEMQADLVAVSLTGSDALIHALARIQVADDAWTRAIAFANTELSKDRAINDIFAIQSRAMFHFANVFNDAAYGNPPPLPLANPEKHRVFKAAMAQPPQMWSSHPLNHEREENAKRVYVSAPIDTQSAWAVFKDPAAVREQATAQLMPTRQLTLAPAAESLAAFDKEYDREFFKRRYCGAYLGRSAVRGATRIEDLYGNASADDLKSLYPDSLAADLEQLRSIAQEKLTLENLQSGALQAPEGVIRHRGNVLSAKELPQAIAEIVAEMNEVETRVSAHDKRCRSAHCAAAAAIQRGWEAHLVGIAGVLHYADHSEANLYDAQRALSNTVHVVLAAGRPNDAGVKRVIKDSNELYVILQQIFTYREVLVLDTTLATRLGMAHWKEALEDFALSAPTKENINEWMKIIDGWVSVAGAALGKLREAALEQLLVSETRVATYYRAGQASEDAPAPPVSPTGYPVLVRGAERKLQTKLGWWARFQNSIGVVPTMARLAVSLGIIGSVLGFSGTVGMATIMIYNGLALPVNVKFGDKKATVAPASSTSIELAPEKHHPVETRSADGRLIETFDADVRASFGNYVYNVASASPLVEWQVIYGGGTPRPEKMLGAPRWSSTEADILFAEPPKQVRAKSAGTTRDVLMGYGNVSPDAALNQLSNDADRAQVIGAHARFDPPNSRYLMFWLSAAASSKVFPEILADRVKANPLDIATLRFEQETIDPAAKASVCARHQSLAQSKPDNASLKYLVARCTAEKGAREAAFLSAYQAAPQNGWSAYAAGYVLAEQASWADALTALETARRNEPVVAPIAIVDIARIRRVLAADGRADLADLEKESEMIRTYLAFERGEMQGDAYAKGFTELSRGKIQQAMDFAKTVPGNAPRLQIFAAASDGADAALASRALALPLDKSLDRGAAWIALALAARQKADMAAYFAKTEAVIKQQMTPEDASAMARVLAALIANAPSNEMDKLMDGLQPEFRGLAYSMALIIQGKSAPAKWRDGAKRLLFALERPYFS